MKILITGGCGFVGTNLGIYLKRKGYKISSLDNLSRKGSRYNLKLIKQNKIKNYNFDISNSKRIIKLPKFDLIIDDVSGISEDLAKVSSWFKEAPADTGRSGVELTEKILLSSKDNLKNTNSELFFPVISLSNTERLLAFARTHYKSVEKKASQSWPLPKDLEKHIDLMLNLKYTGDINFEEKFGMIICNTAVYSAKDPIHD